MKLAACIKIQAVFRGFRVRATYWRLDSRIQEALKVSYHGVDKVVACIKIQAAVRGFLVRAPYRRALYRRALYRRLDRLIQEALEISHHGVDKVVAQSILSSNQQELMTLFCVLRGLEKSGRELPDHLETFLRHQSYLLALKGSNGNLDLTFKHGPEGKGAKGQCTSVLYEMAIRYVNRTGSTVRLDLGERSFSHVMTLLMSVFAAKQRGVTATVNIDGAQLKVDPDMLSTAQTLGQGPYTMTFEPSEGIVDQNWSILGELFAHAKGKKQVGFQAIGRCLIGLSLDHIRQFIKGYNEYNASKKQGVFVSGYGSKVVEGVVFFRTPDGLRWVLGPQGPQLTLELLTKDLVFKSKLRSGRHKMSVTFTFGTLSDGTIVQKSAT